MEEPITLSIRKTEEGVSFDSFGKFPISAIENISMNAELINRINSEIRKLTELSLKETLSLNGELKKLGRLLFEQFIPQNTKTLLRTRETGDLILRLEEPFLEIPWEITFDGINFIGNKFRVGRNILRSSAREMPQTSPSFDKNDKINILVIADPTETLSGALEEAYELCNLLDRHSEFNAELIAGKRDADRFQILKKMSDFDYVHFAGHSVTGSDNPEENGWKLSDGYLTPEEIRNNGNPPKLIFSNSCSSASVSSASVRTGNLGLGGSFLMAGTTHYIGTLWVIHDISSAEFAEFFYTKLVTGASVGKALHYAKQQATVSHPEHEFIWASYVHYGDPRDRLLIPLEKKAKVESDKCYTRRLFTPNNYGEATAPSGRASRVVTIAATILICLVVVGFYLFLNRSPARRNDLIADLYANAVSDYKGGQTEAAHAAFTHLVGRKDNPNGIGTAYLSQIYLEAGLPEQADFFVQKSLKMNPSGIMGNIVAGDREWRNGFPEKAVKAYLFALEDQSALDWQKARAYNSLGAVSFFSGDMRKAETYFMKALPRNGADAVSNLGVLEYFQGNKEKASEWFKKTLTTTPGDEIAALFIKEIARKGAKGKTGSSNGKKIAAGPFIFSSGTIRRIGVDILLREAVSQAIRRCFPELDCSAPTVYGQDYPGFGVSKVGHLRKLTDHLRSLGFRLAVFGEFDTTEHALAVHLKMADVETGQIYLSKKFHAEAKKRVTRIITDIKRDVNESVSTIK